MKGFPIDFIRQVIEQTLFDEHNKNNNYFGGSDQVNLFSFYEQLQKQEEVDRFTEIYQDLIDQQNRTGLIMNGTIVSPENPTITNINKELIIPMTFTCSFRVKLGDRDSALSTINNLISVLKGRKRDIAEFESGKLLMVGTVANRISSISTRAGDYIGSAPSLTNIDTYIASTIKTYYTQKGVNFVESNGTWYYINCNNKLYVIKKIDGTWTQIIDNGEYNNIVFPQNETYTKYKLSLAFDSIRCDEPRNLSAEEYCVISFGGSATLCDYGVMLGNDLTQVGITKLKIIANPDINITDQWRWLEPLEMPNGNSASIIENQLKSNNFLNNSHTDGITPTLQYTFVVEGDFIKQFYKYSRYGKQGTSVMGYLDGITPNMIFSVKEIWSSWGSVEVEEFKAKINDSIDGENNESDVLTITIPLQVQGENN